ncbi:MAG: Yip1 family protein [Elusimicrobiota bacterium]
MSGSDAPVAGFRRAFRPGAGGFAAVLGRFFRDPRRALEEVRAQPRLGQASAALLLALLARFQSRWLDGSAQAGDVLRSLAGGFLLWLALAGVWHAAGRAFKKPGTYRAMLCLAAWSATVYWLVLPAAYLASLLPELAWVQRSFRLAAACGFFYLAWTSLLLN